MNVRTTAGSAGGVLSWSSERQAVLARFMTLLAEADSPLLQAGDDVLSQVEAHVFGLVDTVYAKVTGTPFVANGTAPREKSSRSIGESRAAARIHLSVLLEAASLLFQAALPSIVALASSIGSPHPDVTAAVVLNREILQRINKVARAYVDYLLDKAYSANRDERQRLSRHLHDVAAPSVAVGLQKLELFEVYAPTDPERAECYFAAARRSLFDAMTNIRDVSFDLRDSAATEGLWEAVRRSLDMVPASISTTLSGVPLAKQIPPVYHQELFLITREAVRNAVRHGKPQHIAVTIEVVGVMVSVQITDDGEGFDLDTIRRSNRHVGIDSMFERTELLGGTIEVDTRPCAGTTVTVTAPLPVAAVS